MSASPRFLRHPRRLLAALSALTVAACALLAGPAAPRAEAIIGGAEAGQQRGAAQVWLGPDGSVDSDKKFICTAGVIHREWLITAKHCLVNHDRPSANRLWIRAGDRTLGKGERRQVVRYELADANDLALLRVSRPFPSSVKINSISNRGVTPSTGSNVAVSGWGYPSYVDQHPSRKLKVASMRVQRLDDGSPSFLFAAENDGHNLEGDSGGPVVLGTRQIGVTAKYNPLIGEASIVPLGLPDIHDWITRHVPIP
ncbi:S1 family peptidase [Streptomyces coeruleorubidus]|uniref:S1 family peptidase n=1 Tax=Streptomyces coeruleorubidus TaxID=116188 RepID=UPI0037034B4E